MGVKMKGETLAVFQTTKTILWDQEKFFPPSVVLKHPFSTGQPRKKNHRKGKGFFFLGYPVGLNLIP